MEHCLEQNLALIKALILAPNLVHLMVEGSCDGILLGFLLDYHEGVKLDINEDRLLGTVILIT